MHISARVDYGMQAAVMLALAQTRDREKSAGEPSSAYLSTIDIARACEIPVKFLEGIMADLRRGNLVHSRRGAEGGFALSRDADEISLADVVRVLDGPLAAVRGTAPEGQTYTHAVRHLTDVWVALRAAMRSVLEECSLADAASGDLPSQVRDLLGREGAWKRR